MNKSFQFPLDDPQTVSILDELSLWAAPFGLSLLDTVKFVRGAQILDIGSGLGFPTIELSQRFGNGCKIFAVDPWQAGNERLRWKIAQMKIENIEILEQRAEQLPFEDHSIDLVVSNNGLNNVADMEQVLLECQRVLKPTGQLVFTMNTAASMIEFYEILLAEMTARNLTDSITKLEQHIVSKRKPLNEVEAILLHAGFGIAEKKLDQFSFRYLDGTTMLEHFFIQLAFKISWLEIVPESVRDELFFAVERKMNEYAAIHGEWRMTVPYVTYDCFPLRPVLQ